MIENQILKWQCTLYSAVYQHMDGRLLFTVQRILYPLLLLFSCYKKNNFYYCSYIIFFKINGALKKKKA